MTVKALSLTRPWTTLVLRHGKDVENRTWPTSYRGALLVHAAKSWDQRAVDVAHHDHKGLLISSDRAVHPTGIVGAVKVISVCNLTVDAARQAPLGETWCDCGPWAFPGQHHWRLTDAIEFAEPIPCAGALGLWTPPADLAAVIAGQLAAVTRGT